MRIVLLTTEPRYIVFLLRFFILFLIMCIYPCMECMQMGVGVQQKLEVLDPRKLELQVGVLGLNPGPMLEH